MTYLAESLHRAAEFGPDDVGRFRERSAWNVMINTRSISFAQRSGSDMNNEPKHIPRRDFIKYVGALSAGTAAGVLLTTDAKSQQTAIKALSKSANRPSHYGYLI